MNISMLLMVILFISICNSSAKDPMRLLVTEYRLDYSKESSGSDYGVVFRVQDLGNGTWIIKKADNQKDDLDITNTLMRVEESIKWIDKISKTPPKQYQFEVDLNQEGQWRSLAEESFKNADPQTVIKGRLNDYKSLLDKFFIKHAGLQETLKSINSWHREMIIGLVDNESTVYKNERGQLVFKGNPSVVFQHK